MIPSRIRTYMYVRVRTFGHLPVLVRTGIYRPVPSCDIFQVVRTGTYDSIVQVGTYRYVPVRTDINQVYRIPDEGNIRTSATCKCQWGVHISS